MIYIVMNWYLFIYSIDVAFLGPYLTTICKQLMPLSSIYPADVSKVFYYLIVKNGNLYNEYIPELFFIEDSSISEMHDVWEKIQSESRTWVFICRLLNWSITWDLKFAYILFCKYFCFFHYLDKVNILSLEMLIIEKLGCFYLFLHSKLYF